jgi:predicted AlkP superfamily pyrophosphatase or phosphodiesterase
MRASRLFKPVSAAVAGALWAALSAAVASAEPRADRHVVLISVDGLAAYYLNDPKARMPTLRRLAERGASAAGMVCSFPTVTWPNHTTLVTGVSPGRHGVFVNDYVDRKTGEIVRFIPDPVFDKDEIVKVPTVYDLAHKAGLKTAGIIWPATRNAKSLHWTMPDVFADELFRKYSTPSLLEELRAEGIPYEMQETWCKNPAGGVQRDWMYARATAHVIRRHKPNLTLLHLVEVDHVGHRVGPLTPDAYWACSYADDRVRDVLEAIDAAGLAERTAVLVVSDHGFHAVTKHIHPNVAFRKEGLLKAEGMKIASKQVFAVAQGGSTFVYVLDAGRRDEIIARIRPMLAALEGVQSVIEEKDFPSMGLADRARDPRMADLVLTCRGGYSFTNTHTGDAAVQAVTPRGTHGHDHRDPRLLATFIAAGAGIKRGATLSSVDNRDVAPTIAELLGLKMDNVEGKVLREILSP